MSSEKVPTELAYNYHDRGRQIVWGFQIPAEMPRLQWIKLELDPKQKVKLADNMQYTSKDGLRMELPRHATVESVVTDYIRALMKHTWGEMKRKMGSAFDSMKFSYVMTVPAVWSEKAKTQTRICAERAGLGSSIQMVSEPEAAAIYTLQASQPHNLRVGDTIVICDAGGGTVDLITFTILQLEPTLRLKEAAPGNGALCGSTFINRRFENLVRQRLSGCRDWGEDTLAQAMARFDAVARTFDGALGGGMAIPVPGIPDNNDLGVFRGYARLSEQTMIRLFMPSMQKIRGLISEQIRVSKKKVTAVFLVGGFGQNVCLRSYLRDNLSKEIQLLCPVHGWIAVLRGGLANPLAKYRPSGPPHMFVESRVARRHYGHQINIKFKPAYHDARKK